MRNRPASPSRSSGAFTTRIGGDEFMLILATGEQPAAAEALADRLLKSFAQDFEIRGQRIPIGLSIGAATYPKDAGDIVTLLANADAALYRAKAEGRHMVCFFHPEMDRRLRERYSLQHDLRSAIPTTNWACTISLRPRSMEMSSASKPSCAGNIAKMA